MKCADTVIGKPESGVKGISGGQMKRLSLASEVLTNPAIMFCDEPTSGLDSFMAASVVEMLRTLASQGRTVICTIHQPSSQITELFDKVLLMAEGKTAYLGDMDNANNFLSGCGFPCPINYNPADHWVQALAVVPGNEEKSRRNIETVCSAFNASKDGKALENLPKSPNDTSDTYSQPKSPYKASWGDQFSACMWRSWLSVVKEPLIMKVRIAQTIASILLVTLHKLTYLYNLGNCTNSWLCVLWPRLQNNWGRPKYQWSFVPHHNKHDILKHVCSHQCFYPWSPYFSEGTFQWNVQDWCLLFDKTACWTAYLFHNSTLFSGDFILHGINTYLKIFKAFKIILDSLQWGRWKVLDCHWYHRATNPDSGLFWVLNFLYCKLCTNGSGLWTYSPNSIDAIWRTLPEQWNNSGKIILDVLFCSERGFGATLSVSHWFQALNLKSIQRSFKVQPVRIQRAFNELSKNRKSHTVKV